MTSNLDDTSWVSLVASLGEEMTRRWYGAWRYYSGDWVQLVARAPATRALMAEFIARSYSVSRESIALPIEPSASLEFVVDSEAQSAGPVLISLPPDLHDPAEGLRSVSGVGFDPHCNGKDGESCKKKSATLDQSNVMVRVEGGLLSVTLVGLRSALAQSSESKQESTKPRPAPPARPALSGDYHLHFEGTDRPIALAVKSSG